MRAAVSRAWGQSRRLWITDRSRARGGVACACACGALAAAIGGCASATPTTATITGSTLTIYASAPGAGLGGRQAQDVIAAEQLAFQQAGGQVGHFKVKLVTLDKSKISDNARTVIQDKSAIAYLGEQLPHSSADSLGITNGVGLLQVTPTDTAIELTQKTPAVPGSPQRYYESLSANGRTFGRVVPSAALEAQAQAQAMRDLHVKKVYVTDDGGPYGRAIADEVAKDATAGGITVVRSASSASPASGATVTGSGADAVFLGASASEAARAARLFDDVASIGPKTKLFGPSTLDGGAFASSLGAAAQQRTYLSAPGFTRKDLTPAGQKFDADFVAAYHHAPALAAVFGYEAMSVVLNVIRQAGQFAGSRADVVKDFFATKSRSSALGTYSIDVNGDTSVGPFVISRFKSGKLVPFEFVREGK